jgi:hypothetical protein
LRQIKATRPLGGQIAAAFLPKREIRHVCPFRGPHGARRWPPAGGYGAQAVVVPGRATVLADKARSMEAKTLMVESRDANTILKA